MGEEKESRYWMESQVERKRLATNHFIAKDVMGGDLIRAPVDFSRPVKILDSGAADGTWLLDLASSLNNESSHEFYGTDLNPNPFPQDAPPNFSFRVQDIKKPWPFSDHDRFDLVHQRLTLLGAGPNPATSVAHLYEVVRPAGWIQLCEATMVFPPDIVNQDRTPAYCDLLLLMRNIAEHVGAEWELGCNLRGLLEAAGFIDIGEEDVELKMGATNSNEKLCEDGIQSCGLAIQGLSAFAKTFPENEQSLEPERYDTLENDLKKELRDKGAVFPLKVVWGRKPA